MKKTKKKALTTAKRGRPTSVYGAKKSRSLSLSDVAYESLQSIAAEHGVNSLSEFLEKIGHQEIVIDSQSNAVRPFESIPIVHQFRTLLENPSGTLISTLAFTIKLSSQLNLPQSPEFLSEVVLDAMLAFFCRSYLHPDQAIDSPGSWLRWYIIHILDGRATHSLKEDYSDSKHFRYKADRNISQQCISTIFYSRKKLYETDMVSHLYALKLRMWPYELSISQIEVVCRAQDVSKTGFELINKGVSTFRRLWVQEELKNPDIPRVAKRALKEAEEYCNLMQSKTLQDKEIDRLKSLVRQCLYFPDYDFWSNEIDFFLFYQLCESPDAYENGVREIISMISTKLEKLIFQKKIELDRNLLDRETAKSLASFLARSVAQYFRKDASSMQRIERKNLIVIANPVSTHIPLQLRTRKASFSVTNQEDS